MFTFAERKPSASDCWRAVLVLVACAGLLAFAPAEAAWKKSAGYGLNNRHEAWEGDIDRHNVDQLKHEWTYYTTDDGPDGIYAGVEAKPLRHLGVLYFPSTDGFLHAIDAETGAPVWKKSFLDDYSDEAEGRRVYLSRNTPVARGNVIYIGTVAPIATIDRNNGICETSFNAAGCQPGSTGTYLLAINRNTGDLISATQLDDSNFSYMTASPIIYKNRILVTLSSIEEISGQASDPDIVPDPVNDFLRCCRFRGKTLSVKLYGTALASTPDWTFYHVPSFDGPNNKNRLPAGHPDRVQFEADIAAFEAARAEFLDALGPTNARYVELGDETPLMENFSGAGSWGRGNPAVDIKRNMVLVAPGSNYSAPDLYRQCQRVRQGNIDPVPGNKNILAGDLDPEAFMPPGLNCDNLNLRLDNYVNQVVAIDIRTGQERWAMRPELLDAEPDLHIYDVWNTQCTVGGLADFTFGISFISPLRGESPFFDLDFAQQTQCDSLVKPDDYGFAQQPMILRNVKVDGFAKKMDLGVIGQKSGALYRFDLKTGGQIFYDRMKLGDGGILAGISWPGASDGNVIYTAINNSANHLRDVRKSFYSTRDDDIDLGGTRGPHRADPRFSGVFGGPRNIVAMANPSKTTFIDADVRIFFDKGCSEYPVGSVSRQLCDGVDPFTNNNNADAFRINEFGENPYTRRVEVVRDWRDQAPGGDLGGVANPNQVANPVPDNIEANMGNRILTVRDLNDCSNPSDPDTCVVKTVAGFWLAVDAGSGEVLWTQTHPGGMRIHSQLTLSGDVVYSGAQGSETLFLESLEFPSVGTLIPDGGGLRYALDKDTGEILYRFHDELVNAGIGVDEYVSSHPLVTKDRVFWGTGAGHYIATLPSTSGNALHSFKLVKEDDDDDDQTRRGIRRWWRWW